MFLFSMLKPKTKIKRQATPLSAEDLKLYKLRKLHREYQEQIERLALADKQQKPRCSLCCWGQ